jgi:hypothetical protein
MRGNGADVDLDGRRHLFTGYRLYWLPEEISRVIQCIGDLQPPVASGALADDVLPEVDVGMLFLEFAAQPNGIVAAVGAGVGDGY